MNSSESITSIFPLLIAIVFIQGGASLAKQLFPAVGAPGATLLRLGFATLILFCIWHPWKVKLTRRAIRSILIYGASLGAMNLFFYMALARLPMGITVAIEFTGPLGVALISSRKPFDFLWTALATAGILLILPVSPSSVPLDILGVLYALIAGISWGLYIFFGQKAGAAIHGGTATALGMLTGTLVVLPFGIASAGSKLLNPSILPLAVVVALLSSALPYSLEMVAMKKLRTQTFGILMSLEPAIAALSGLFFLNEHLALPQWAAILCIILASAGTSATAARP